MTIECIFEVGCILVLFMTSQASGIHFATVEIERTWVSAPNMTPTSSPPASPPPVTASNVTAVYTETFADYSRKLMQDNLIMNAKPVDTIYYLLIRLYLEGDVPNTTEALTYLQDQLKLYIATYGAEVSQYVIDYLTTLLTNNVDPASGLSGSHRRLMDIINGNGTGVVANTTAVIVAIQSQSWTTMQQTR